MRSTAIIVAVLALSAISLGSPLQTQEAENHKQETQLTVLILSDASEKPIPDAHVVVRFVVERTLRRDRRVSWESKTNRGGKVVLEDVPEGAVRVQIIARGYRTYGDQHEITGSEQELTIRLTRPQGQVSSY